VSHGFHSALMDGAAAAFADVVARVSLAAPRLPLISNLSGAVAGREVTEPGYWARQLRAPVRFAEGLVAARRAGCDHFLELGPRPSLLGLAASVVGADAV